MTKQLLAVLKTRVLIRSEYSTWVKPGTRGLWFVLQGLSIIYQRTAKGKAGSTFILPSGRVQAAMGCCPREEEGGEGHSCSGWPACTFLYYRLRNRCSAGRAENKKTLLFGSLGGNSKQRFNFPHQRLPRLHLCAWLPGSPPWKAPSVGTGNSSRAPPPAPAPPSLRPTPGLRPRPQAQAPLSSGAAPGLRPRSHLLPAPRPHPGPRPALTSAPTLPAPGPAPRPRPRPHIGSPGSRVQAPPSPGPRPHLWSRDPPARSPRSGALRPLPWLPPPPSPLLSARLATVRICPRWTLRISFWGPSCSRFAVWRVVSGPRRAVAGVTAAPLLPPLPGVVVGRRPRPSCPTPAGTGPARRGGGQGRAPLERGREPAPPPPIFTPSRPRRRGRPGAPGPRRPAPARAAAAAGAGGAEPRPAWDPERPARNTTRAGSGDGSDGRVNYVPCPTSPRVLGSPGWAAQGERSANLRPHSRVAAMLPPSLGSRAAGTAPGRNLFPAGSWGAPTLPNSGSLQRHSGLAAQSPRVQVPCGPATDGRGPLVGLRVPPATLWWSVPLPPPPGGPGPVGSPDRGLQFLAHPTPSGAHGREEHFREAPLAREGNFFVRKEAIPWANRKLARAWRARRNQRVTHRPEDDSGQEKVWAQARTRTA